MGLSASGHRARALGAFGFALAVGVGFSRTAHSAPKIQDAKAVESARSQFYRALALQDQGRWAEALELLEKVAETRESAQVRFNIAFDQEHLGRLAAAARGYERAIALAEQSGAENVIHAANGRLQGLSQRIARLVLRPVVLVGGTPTAPGEGVSVKLDGVELASRDWGSAVPVEVGDHTIHANAVGHKPYRASVTLPGGETRELRIELVPAHEVRVAAIADAELPVRSLEPVSVLMRAPAPPNQQQESKGSLLPYVAAGAAVLSMATAAVFYTLRKDALDTMRAGCHEGRCPDDLRSIDQRGALYTTIANVALATGVGLAGVSAGLFISEIDDGDDGERVVGVRASVSTAF